MDIGNLTFVKNIAFCSKKNNNGDTDKKNAPKDNNNSNVMDLTQKILANQNKARVNIAKEPNTCHEYLDLKIEELEQHLKTLENESSIASVREDIEALKKLKNLDSKKYSHLRFHAKCAEMMLLHLTVRDKDFDKKIEALNSLPEHFAEKIDVQTIFEFLGADRLEERFDLLRDVHPEMAKNMDSRTISEIVLSNDYIGETKAQRGLRLANEQRNLERETIIEQCDEKILEINEEIKGLNSRRGKKYKYKCGEKAMFELLKGLDQDKYGGKFNTEQFNYSLDIDSKEHETVKENIETLNNLDELIAEKVADDNLVALLFTENLSENLKSMSKISPKMMEKMSNDLFVYYTTGEKSPAMKAEDALQEMITMALKDTELGDTPYDKALKKQTRGRVLDFPSKR